MLQSGFLIHKCISILMVTWLVQTKSYFLWLERPGNTLANSQLVCTIKTPLDDGEALISMCAAIEAFMPENTISGLATMAACIMASTYHDVISCCGCSGVPLLKTEA